LIEGPSENDILKEIRGGKTTHVIDGRSYEFQMISYEQITAVMSGECKAEHNFMKKPLEAYTKLLTTGSDPKHEGDVQARFNAYMEVENVWVMFRSTGTEEWKRFNETTKNSAKKKTIILKRLKIMEKERKQRLNKPGENDQKIPEPPSTVKWHWPTEFEDEKNQLDSESSEEIKQEEREYTLAADLSVKGFQGTKTTTFQNIRSDMLKKAKNIIEEIKTDMECCRDYLTGRERLKKMKSKIDKGLQNVDTYITALKKEMQRMKGKCEMGVSYLIKTKKSKKDPEKMVPSVLDWIQRGAQVHCGKCEQCRFKERERVS